jgi:hypothetical protein
MNAILKDDYWVVGTNKWTASIYTKQQAEKLAATLINCDNCIDCSYCSSCSDCSSCSYCSSCSDFKTNPERITSPILGSRSSQTTFYWNAEREQVICGCFKGTMQEFEDKVKQTHGDNEHGRAYLQWIEKVKTYTT